MELVGIDLSKVVYLIAVHRAAGPAYRPDVVQAVTQRYAFVNSPTATDLLKNELNFTMGKFRDVQIQDFSVYTDGVIANCAGDSDILEAFLEDLFSWIKATFDIVPMGDAKPEISFESSIIVKSKVDLANALGPQTEVIAAVNKIYLSGRYAAIPLERSGFVLSSNPAEISARRRPISFLVDRRETIPFDQNIFYSRAPLRTKDHLAALRALEDLASRR